MNTSPWLKNQSDAVGESSISEVEVAQRERPAQVGEPEQEHEAESAPQPGAVDLGAAERALVAARHLPGDLRSVHASVTTPLASSTVPSAISPRLPHQIFTVQLEVFGSYVSSSSGPSSG